MPQPFPPGHGRQRRDSRAARRPAKTVVSSRRASRNTLWLALGLLILTGAVFAPVAHFDFVNWDDPEYVTANPGVLNGLTWRGIVWAFTTGHGGNWHPLTWISHMLDVQVFGLNPGAHHLVNLLFHGANTLLLFQLWSKMTGKTWRSAFVAALFAVHPAHVESVAWIAERKDVLSTFFGLLTMNAYAAYTQESRPRQAWTCYAGALILFACSLMAKPMLVTLPFLLLLLDYWPLQRLPGFGRQISKADIGPEARERRPAGIGRLLTEKIPFFILTASSSVVTFYAQKRADAVTGFDELPLGARLQNAIVSYQAYIGKMVWPSKLAVVYPFPPPPAMSWVAAIALVLAAITLIALRRARRERYWLVGWLWFVGTLIPVIGLVQVGSQAMADRYTYVPFVGLFVILAWTVPGFFERRQAGGVWPVALAIGAIAACAVVASGQVAHWRNSESLWEHTLSVTSENARAETNLGNAIAAEGRFDEAVAHYLDALRYHPESPDALDNLGVALAHEGRFDEAVQRYREALRIRPNDPLAHNNLGSALQNQQKTAEAIEHYEAALRLNPDFMEAHNNLAAALAAGGKTQAAIAEFLEALRLRPDQADLHYNVAIMYVRIGNTNEAIQHLERALQLEPGHAAARDTLDDLARAQRIMP
jgi:Flp pilus assembly protein TadD